ncbi:MAG: hypothetical protein HY361_01325 [Candidatus Aenigmarchaeota archaeon]|nr:hypothetical protein [Candidatus Aenigmarchaeota archaeon]
MEEIATAQLSLINDRGVKKLRVNLIRKGKISGYLRPINPFRERRQPPGGIP